MFGLRQRFSIGNLPFIWVAILVFTEWKKFEVFILKGQRLYFLIADANPPTDFDMLNKGADALIKTITFVE